jgi:putative endonuclease
VNDAIAREKQLKRWVRSKKNWLVETKNPNWDDWGEGFF